MPQRIIKTDHQRDQLATFLAGQKLPMTVTWSHGKHRTAAQNALQWMWCGEIAEQLGDRDAAAVQAEFKLEIGVPILRAENDDFREKYDSTIRGLTYEQKITVMREFSFPVSSLMNVKQNIRYLDEIYARYVGRGFELTDPDPEMVGYMKRYRGDGNDTT